MTKSTIARLLFGLGVLFSAVLVCVSAGVMLLTFSWPLDENSRIGIINRSGETLYITPVGKAYNERRFLLSKEADVRLAPEELVSIEYDPGGLDPDEWWLASEIIVRNEQKEYRQLTLTMTDPTDITVTLRPFDRLDPALPEALAVAEKARPHDSRGGVKVEESPLGWILLPVGVALPCVLFWGSRKLRRAAKEGL